MRRVIVVIAAVVVVGLCWWGSVVITRPQTVDAAGSCRVWVANNAAHASCDWGTGYLTGFFVNALGVGYSKRKVVYPGTGVTHVFPNAGGRTVGAVVLT